MNGSISTRVTALAAVLVLAGCGAPPEDEGPREITVAGTGAPDTVGEAQWLEFRDRVHRNTDRFRLQMLIYGQVGPEEQILSGLRRGRIHIANVSALAASTVRPELAILYAPYLFEDREEADFVFDRYLTGRVRELLAAEGMHLITWYEIGFHHVYGKQPIRVPAHAEGVRFRVSSSPAAQMFAEAIGADVIPLGFSDVVPALQTDLISAGENAVSLYARTGIASEAPHLTLTGHAFGTSVIVARKSWWDALTPDEQALFSRAYPDIGESRVAVRAETDRDLANAHALGFEVHRLDAAQRARWIEATRGTHQALIERLGGRTRELYELIRTGRAAYRRSQRDASPDPALRSPSSGRSMSDLKHKHGIIAHVRDLNFPRFIQRQFRPLLHLAQQGRRVEINRIVFSVGQDFTDDVELLHRFVLLVRRPFLKILGIANRHSPGGEIAIGVLGIVQGGFKLLQFIIAPQQILAEDVRSPECGHADSGE